MARSTSTSRTGRSLTRNGDRYPQWLAKRDYRQFFRVADFDAWYFDNVMIRSRVQAGQLAPRRQRLASRDPDVEAAFRRGMADHWEAAAEAELRACC